MDIGAACTREVYVVGPGEPLLQAAVEMLRRNVGCIVVVEQRGKTTVPVGIMTNRDIVRILPEHAQNIASLAVIDAMTRDPFTLGEGESIVDGTERLRWRGVRRAPVVSPTGALVGIVSFDDLLGIIAEQLGSLARLVERQGSGQ